MTGFQSKRAMSEDGWIDAKVKEKRDQYWKMLYAARSDFMKLTEQSSADTESVHSAFYYYLQRNYGLKMELIDGKITSNYVITDEKKYTLFLLKYAGN
jgi:hypothetical protein